MHTLFATRLRTRLFWLVVLGLVALNTNSVALGRTLAYFTSSANSPTGAMSIVQLNIGTSPTVSGVFDISSNMVPGDFQVNLFDISNGGTSGVAQQAFTYAVSTTSSGAGNRCSLLDVTNVGTCSSPAVPSAAAGSGAALLLFRCTSDVAATIPLACGTQGVYVTQVYPASGAGTQQQVTAATGLSRPAIGGVATASGNYTVTIGGRAFTGGQLLIGTPVGLGGPDAIAGADGQTHGLAAARTDHLASVVYLPTQAGDALANQTSILTFTWTATQRLGSTR